jgi:hypothetical protein
MFTGAARRRGKLLSHLPAGDVDYYAFDVAMSDSIMATCEGESGGSGVRGLTAELFDPAGASLQAGVEPSTINLSLQALRVEQAGRYTLKLGSSHDAATAGAKGIEPWVRCAVVVSH